MNKPQATNDLIPVRDFKHPNNRGSYCSVQYIYKLIREHKQGLRESLPFDYKQIGKAIWIKK